MNKFKSQEDIIGNLVILDNELSNLHLKNKIELIIFGGTAFLLRTNDIRATSDIDVFITSQITTEIETILHQHNINQRISGIMEVPPIEEFLPRSDRLNILFDNLIVRVASKEDLIISKLFSTRQSPKDINDLVQTDLIDTCDINLLWELYNGYKKDVIFPLNRYNDLEEVLILREEYKRKR